MIINYNLYEEFSNLSYCRLNSKEGVLCFAKEDLIEDSKVEISKDIIDECLLTPTELLKYVKGENIVGCLRQKKGNICKRVWFIMKSFCKKGAEYVIQTDTFFKEEKRTINNLFKDGDTL